MMIKVLLSSSLVIAELAFLLGSVWVFVWLKNCRRQMFGVTRQIRDFAKTPRLQLRSAKDMLQQLVNVVGINMLPAPARLPVRVGISLLKYVPLRR